jgi:hypothetical protein
MAPAPPPVVLVVFDALPIQLLEDADGRIDGARFPNFAALAAQGTWYRHATTVSEGTRFSVPALLDGRRPRPGVPEDYVGHPVNLFTLLGAHHYRMNVSEEATDMCPVPLCPPRSRMTVLQRMRRGRVTRFRRGVAHVTNGARPELTFIHTLLPHEPRQFLPDGHSYTFTGIPDALGGTASLDRRFLTEQVEQRTLLQLEFADRLLGELIARMKREGVWNRSLLAVVSDHGESFRVKKGAGSPFRIGELSFRRAVSIQNLQDIAGIAMFVKYPGERTGRIDDRYVRQVDLLPTILGLAHIPRPADLIGTPLTDPLYRGHKDVAVYKQTGELVSMPVTRWQQRVHESKTHELALFGSGTKSLFDFGPAPQLRGTAVSALELAPSSKLRATVATASRFASVRPRSSFLPAEVFGRLLGGSPTGHDLLFALNGTVVATAPSFAPAGGDKLDFSAMLPPDAFRAGANKLEIFEWLGGLSARRLYG